MPDHRRLIARGQLQRTRHVALAIDSGKDEDGGFHVVTLLGRARNSELPTTYSFPPSGATARRRALTGERGIPHISLDSRTIWSWLPAELLWRWDCRGAWIRRLILDSGPHSCRNANRHFLSVRAVRLAQIVRPAQPVARNPRSPVPRQSRCCCGGRLRDQGTGTSRRSSCCPQTRSCE